MRLVEQAHSLIEKSIHPGDAAIDATTGNGNDTVFLAELVGPNGKVFGFDLQEIAIEITRIVLKTKKCSEQCELFQLGHQHMQQTIPVAYHGKLACVMFNLGYLPHGDKKMVTQPETTLSALDQAMLLLRTSGLLSVLAYRGHPGGMDEYEAVSDWIRAHDDAFQNIYQQDSEHPEHKGPYLWLLQKQ